jgi:fructose-specific component phosphotransferase system IIB-like protein
MILLSLGYVVCYVAMFYFTFLAKRNKKTVIKLREEKEKVIIICSSVGYVSRLNK